MIEKSVGRQGVNTFNDTLIIQSALTVLRVRGGQKPIAIDGLVGPETIGAITGLQQREGLPADGRADVDGPTVKRIRSLLGNEALVFGPTISRLAVLLDALNGAAIVAPPEVGAAIARTASRLSFVPRNKDLANGLPADLPRPLPGFGGRPNTVGVAVVDDLAVTLLILFLMMELLTVVVTNPAFRKAVQAQAKELDRVMGELKNAVVTGFNESVDLVLDIVKTTVDDANRCGKSPGFNPSPECKEAIRNLRAIRDRISGQLSKVRQLIAQFVSGNLQGLPISTLKTDINRLISQMQKNAADIQVALADMKDKCNCPDT